ncbi:dicarboxylate/amino acid:cation symporter [Sphingosinicellaceae bacterium]|nr:dicarboxylate/amino acid:cation symporter [Sphingosinicellaceae bacterium]
MTLTVRIFLALVLGLGGGIALAAFASPDIVARIASVAEPTGGIWLDALQMTIIPLVFGLLFTGIVSAAGSAGASKLAGRGLLWFAVIIIAGGAMSVIVVPLLLQLVPIPETAAKALLATAGAAPAAVPLSAGAWVRSFVPSNAFSVAAEGKMLPLVVFGMAFAFAATRIPDAPRAALNGFFDAVVQTMLVLVEWVLWLAPVGVFALALLVGAHAGLGAIGVLAHYVGIVIAVQLVLIAGLYGLVAVFRPVPFMLFVRAMIPVQVVALSTQSSIATLPAMVEAANESLKLPQPLTRLILPLAVSIFRATSAPANLAVVVYVAHLHGLVLSPTTLAAGVAVAFAVSIAAIGLPGQVSFITSVAPIALAMGVPITTLPLLIAVELLPDLFRTIGNVTGDVAVTALVGKGKAGSQNP